MKSSQTKKMSAVLAAMAVLWGGGTLFFGGDSVSAAVDQAAVLKKVATDGNISNLTPEEKTWFDNFFGGKTLQSGEKALQSGERGLSSTDKVLNEKEKNWLDAMSKTIKAEDNSIIAGNNNEAYYTGGTEIVYGSSNSYYIQSVALGHQNDSLGRDSLAVGRGNATLGREGVSIGYSSVAGPYEGRQDKSSAVAIGERAYASGVGLAFGGYSVAMGTRGIALGYEAQAGKPEIAHMWDDYAYDSDPIYKDLIEHNPDIFGSYEDLKGKTPGETRANASAKVEPMIFEHYKSYFSSIGIKTLEDLRKKDNGQRLLRILGYQMVYSKDNVNYPIAIGTQAHAYSNGALALGTGSEVQGDYGTALGYRATVGKEINNGVALGAYSAVTKADMDEVNSSLKDKAPFSGITLRQSGNLGSDGNANGEYLTGAISIGGPRYVQKDVNGEMQTVQEGNYVRQIKHLADGTDPTDAVNLRQLQGLETKLSQGSTSNTFALAGDIGMTTSDKTVAEKTITKELGNTINIVGGVVAKTDAAVTDNNDVAIGNGEATTPATTPTITEAGLTDNNIGVVSDGKDTLTIKLANTLKEITSIEGVVEANGKLSFTTDALTLTRTTGGTNASIIMGTQDSSIEATQGIHLSYGNTKVRIDANGLDVGSKQIHSVQSGMATSASHTDSETGDATTSSGNADTNNEGTTTPSYTLDVSKLANDDKRLTNAANIGDLRTAAQGLEEKINDLDTSFNTTVNGLKPITVMGDKEVKNTDGLPKYPNGVITTEAVKDSNNKITGYIVKADLSAYAKTSSLTQYIKQGDLKNYIDQSTLDAKLEKYAKLDASNLTDENNIKAWKEKLGVTAPPEVKGGSLDYSANGANTQTIDLDKEGLNFVDGTNTTATVGANGEVKYDLKSKLTGIESIKGKDDTKGELKFTTEGAKLSHQTNSIQVGNEIKATAGNNTLVLGDAIEAKSGNNSLSVGDTIKATVGTNSLTVGNTIEAKAGQNLFALSDNDLTAAVGQAHMTIDKEKWETVFNDATSTVMKDTSITTTAGKSTLALSDTTSTLTVGNKDTGSTAMSQTTDTVAWTVTGKATDGKPAPTTTVSITAEGLDVGKTIIRNLADGEAPTDAATVGQLTIAKREFDTHFTKLDGDVTNLDNRMTTVEGDVVNLQNSMNGMNTRITKLDRRVDKVGAGAAALAALHPLDFDPDNKWDIAGGYGHYAGQSAMALGAYYRPNEEVMFSIGGAFGNGEDMINAGVSVKVGSGESKTTTSKAAMAKKINELQQVVTTQHQQLEEQKANMAKQDAKIAAQENEIQELKAIMQQILAK